MPAYNVTLKKGASKEDVEAAKKKAVDQGGKITNEFTIIPGFTVEFPEDKVSVLESDENLTVEKDAEVRTQ
ncbi:uncharacterized protein EI97DRAFT_455607 [Westerdykella ornata]|uniref:Inhibitor I9 domain-containing protein n=1 Tax=Westerdykella ornata TaxID=318751 RepID=A0A6A6JU38_WESOR|nr:uncharacterized protein EI97DRAFT_455607 [Westerdykella ornata]KAF2279348.1 hypothetical protein EI97DRAFT_455607 [Westerdykella ornata]